jgi:hypothetical protein
MRLYLKNNESQEKAWGHASSNRAPKFNPQYCQKQKKNKMWDMGFLLSLSKV